MPSTAIDLKTGVFTEVRAPDEKLQIKHVLCPVDFSECSRRALDVAAKLVRRFGARLYIQHTAQPLLVGDPQSAMTVVDVDTLLRSARAEVRRLMIDHGIDTSEATVLLNDGDPSARILGTISHEHADLVVMGTHGRGSVGRALFGSVTEDVIHKARCPVLVVGARQECFADPEGDGLKTILLATDLTPRSDRALAYAFAWAWEWGARLVLFHGVVQPAKELHGMVDLFPEYNPAFEKQLARARDRICNLVAAKAHPGFEVIFEVRQGDPKEEVLREAKEQHAGLIITGACATGWSHAPWSAVSSAIARDGRFPVLVIPERTA